MKTIAASLNDKDAQSFLAHIDALKAGISGGSIRNVVIKEAKFHLSRHIDNAAQTIMKTDNLYGSCHEISGYIMPHEAAARLRRLKPLTDDPKFARYLSLVREVAAINDLYKAAKPLIVKGRVPSEKRVDPRALENTGSCAICARNQKLAKNGTMVLHGYKRPGNGYTYGNCFGYRFKPYEISTEANVAFDGYLDTLIANEQRKLDNLRTGKVISFTREKREYVGHMVKVIYETITKDGNPREYATMLKHAIYEAEQNLRWLITDKKRNSEKIAKWQPHPTQ